MIRHGEWVSGGGASSGRRRHPGGSRGPLGFVAGVILGNIEEPAQRGIVEKGREIGCDHLLRRVNVDHAGGGALDDGRVTHALRGVAVDGFAVYEEFERRARTFLGLGLRLLGFLGRGGFVARGGSLGVDGAHSQTGTDGHGQDGRHDEKAEREGHLHERAGGTERVPLRWRTTAAGISWAGGSRV